MKWKLIMLIGVWSCFSYMAHAQENQRVSLNQAIQVGLENSKPLQISLSEKRGAEAFTHQMKDNKLPDIGLSGQYLRLNAPSVSLNPNLTGDNSSGGGSSSSAVPKYLMLGQGSVSMPLFSGFRLKYGVESAKYLEKAADLSVESQRSEVILNLVQAYYTLYKAEEAVKLVSENLERAHQRVSDFQNMEENGLLAKNDLLKAQLMESNTSLALLDARNNARVANHTLNLLLGYPEDSQIGTDSLLISELPNVQSIEEWRNHAMGDRKDLLAVSEQAKASHLAIKSAKGAYWPSVALTGGYVMADLDNILTLTNAMNVGIGVNFNIAELFKGGAKVHQAEEQYLQTQLRQEQLTDKIKSEVFQSFSDYIESKERISVYKKANDQASENFRIVNNKHKNSLATTTELLDADVDQFQAKLNLKFAEVDAFIAYCKLLQVSGQLDLTSINHLIVKE